MSYFKSKKNPKEYRKSRFNLKKKFTKTRSSSSDSSRSSGSSGLSDKQKSYLKKVNPTAYANYTKNRSNRIGVSNATRSDRSVNTQTQTRTQSYSGGGESRAEQYNKLYNRKGYLKHGSRGAEVSDLQRFLNSQGAGLKEDGIFGKNTARALKNYQSAQGLRADSIVGDRTHAKIFGNGGGSRGIQTTDAIRNDYERAQLRYNDAINGLATGATAGITGIGSEVIGAGSAISPDVKSDVDKLFSQGYSDPKEIAKMLGGEAPIKQIESRVKELNSGTTGLYGEYAEEYRKEIDDIDREQDKFRQDLDKARAKLDEIGQAQIDGIQANYDSAREVLKGSYDDLARQREKFGYQTDSYRYTPMQQEGIMVADQQEFIIKMAQIDADETNALAKAKTAIADKDYDILLQSMDAFDNAKKRKSDLLQHMLDASLETMKAVNESSMSVKYGEGTDFKDIIEILEQQAPAIQQDLENMSEGERYLYKQELASQLGVPASTIESELIRWGMIKDKKSADLKNVYSTIHKRNSSSSRSSSRSSSSGGSGYTGTKTQQQGQIITDFVDMLEQKKIDLQWAGLNPNEYKEARDIIVDEYGTSAGNAFDKELKRRYLYVDNKKYE